MDDRMGENVNGPSLINAPPWLENPLGKYYLYFGHHDGRYIRMAYADNLVGPWKTHGPGVLSLENSHFSGHIASPDVHVDRDGKQVRMYFHGADTATGKGGPQSTRVSLSTDGLTFDARPELLVNPYMRTFRWNQQYFGLAMPGVFYRSVDGASNFEQGPTLFNPNIRHTVVLVNDDLLRVYFTVIGDNPERILLSTVRLSNDWLEWEASDPVVVLAPEVDWQGADLPLEPPKRGLVQGRVNQLRDPATFIDDDGRMYLLYAVVGESGIAIAELAE
jgi:hypothetical protein